MIQNGKQLGFTYHHSMICFDLVGGLVIYLRTCFHATQDAFEQFSNAFGGKIFSLEC